MVRSRLYRCLLLVATGGMLFQAATSCKAQAIDLLMTTVVPALTSALTSSLAAAVQSGIST